MLTEPLDPEFSITSAITDAQNKRKRDFLRQASQTSIDEEAIRSHKRTASPNNSTIFRAAAAHDVEERQEPDDDEINLVNAYRSRHEEQSVQTSSEPLYDVPSPQHQCDYSFSPVPSFFHPAILRATTICESASDIFCGDPPEVDSRPCSPLHIGEASDDACDEVTEKKKEEREVPSWLNGTPAFNWNISKSGVSPWTGVFQFGSS